MRAGNFKTVLTAALFVSGALLSGCARPAENGPQPSAVSNAAEQPAQGGSSNVNIPNDIPNAPVETPTPQSGPTAALNKEEEQKTIADYIAAAARAADGNEYEDARTILYGDLDGDGDEDAAVQFTIEGMGGGNNYIFYLAIFKNENGKLTPVTDEAIGGKMNRNIELKKIENGKMFFDTQEYDADDGACCPSIEGKTAYILEGNKLKEVGKK